MSSQTNEKKELIKFYLDEKPFLVKKLSNKESLSSVRHELLSKNNIDFIFVMKDGFKIEPQEENDFSLIDILDGNIIYLKSIKGKITDDTEKNNIQFIDSLKEEIKDKLINLYNQTIDEPPAIIPIINNINPKQKQIIEYKNNEDKKINKINIIEKEIHKETPNFGLTEAIKIKVFINGIFKFEVEMDKNWNLIKVRKRLLGFIENDFFFLLSDGFVINHNEEEIFSLEGILNEDKIYINQEQLILDINNKNNSNNNSNILLQEKTFENVDNNLEIDKKKDENKEIELFNNNKKKDKNIKDNKHLKNLLKECRRLENIGNLEIYLYPRYEFTSIEKKNSVNFMVLGPTGSGKTTLLNAFVNYLLGVKLEDDFRFKLIHEQFFVSMTESQTRDVIIYNIRPFDKNIPPIRVIDTPGFGDSFELDKLICDKISEIFRNNISHINAICFVAQSTNNKITIKQKYILNRIINLFSEDVKENIIAIFTFCNIIEKNFVYLENFKKIGPEFDLILKTIEKTQKYFLFDNLYIFKSTENEKLNKIIKPFYELTMENFDKFMNKLILLPNNTLKNTIKVIDDRKSLENKIIIFEEIVKDCLNKIDEFHRIYNLVKKYNKELKTKNYIYKVRVTKLRKVPTQNGKSCFTCLICSHICQKDCDYGIANEKRGLAVIDQSTGKCTVCRKRCDWTVHECRDFFWEEYETEVIKTDE